MLVENHQFFLTLQVFSTVFGHLVKIFCVRKLESLGYQTAWRRLHGHVFRCFYRTPACDRQTDRQTDAEPQHIPRKHSIARVART